MSSHSKSTQDSWVKVIQVNSIEYNYDKSVIIIATNRGYQVYDTSTYSSLSRIEESQDLIGPISKASAFHKSHLVCFLGSNENKVYKTNQVVIWNDDYNKKEGLIKLYDTILTFSLLTYALCVFVPFRLLLFNVTNLQFVLKLEDFPNLPRLINFSDTNPFMIANCSNLNKKTIKLSSFSIKDKKIYGKKEMILKTDFDEIQNISFGKSASLLIIVSQNGSRMHIYNTDTYRLKYCLNLHLQIESKLSNYCFDDKEKFMMFTVNQNEIKVFKMYGKKNSYSYKCLCYENDPKKIDQNKTKSNGFNSFFNKMFTESPSEYSSYKFKEGGLCRLFMNPLSKNVMSLIFQNGYASQLQLDRKKKNKMKLLKENVWLK